MPDHQRSVLEQMIDVHQAAIAAGMYDAADWLERSYPWPKRVGGWREDLAVHGTGRLRRPAGGT